MTQTVKTASIPPTPESCDFAVSTPFASGAERITNRQRGVLKIRKERLSRSWEESCPKKSPMQLPRAGFSRLAFPTIGKRIVFIGKTACRRADSRSPVRASEARHQTLCAIDQAHCEVQKAQSRVTHPAAGDLRRAEKRRSLREKGCSVAVCVGQSASRSVPQSNRSA